MTGLEPGSPAAGSNRAVNCGETMNKLKIAAQKSFIDLIQFCDAEGDVTNRSKLHNSKRKVNSPITLRAPKLSSGECRDLNSRPLRL